MPRFLTGSFVWASLGIAAWAQTASTSEHFKVAGIEPVIDRSPQLSSAPAQAKDARSAKPVPFNGIQYQGGPVMNDPRGANIYLIWYGNWSDSEAVPIVTDFIEHIGGTAYWKINTSYYDFTAEGEKDPIKNRINYGGSIVDNYSYGSTLTDDDIGFIIQDAATSGRLPYDLNGQYYILASADVTETSGLCDIYCGFHGYQPLPNGDNLVGGFIGNPERCAIDCTAQLSTPNNSLAADGMATIIAHEMSESVTDPYLTGWINLQTDGSEDGDLCVWTFGKTKPLPNGSFYNVRFGTRNYLIQRLWVNARGGYCAMALDE